MSPLTGRAYMLGGCVLAGAIGCQSKVSECNKLAEIVNHGVTQIEKVESRAAEDAAEYARDAKEVAELADQTAAAVGALKIETAELKLRAETYQAVARDMAAVSREFAELMKKAEAVKDERLGTADAKFSETQSTLEKLCNTGNDDCTAVAELLEKQPENPDESELAGVLAAYAEELEEIGKHRVAGEGLKEAIVEHVAAARAYKVVLEDWNVLQIEVDAAEAELDAIVAREDAAVADLNKFCVGS